MGDKDLSRRLRKAVKENNLFLVRRLVQRTDMRNPDPNPNRYTSLAWSAVLGHEETFEYLLSSGHDDDELSKDAENNTILILLAGLPTGPTTPHRTSSDSQIQGAALRMARLYYERFPFILDWSNVQGKTSLHVAALKGNEEFVRMICDFRADFDLTDLQGNTPLHYASAWGHIPVVQLLIERGCQFTAKNNEGFTASDYAYSYNTMNVLQETARAQFETNKKARRGIQQASARGGDWSRSNTDDTDDTAKYTSSIRMRSGSGGSRTTVTSDSADLDSLQLSPHSTASSNQRLPPSNGTILPPIPAGSAAQILPPPRSPASMQAISNSRTNNPLQLSTSSGLLPQKFPRQGDNSAPKTAPQHPVHAASNSATVTANILAALSPIATRMRERDEAAMAEYMKRQRSGSNSSSADGSLAKPAATTSAAVVPPPPSPHDLIAGDARIRAIPRLRPSVSAASLRPGTPDETSERRMNRVIASPSKEAPHTLPSLDFTVPTRRLPKIGEIPSGHGRRPSGTIFRELALRSDAI